MAVKTPEDMKKTLVKAFEKKLSALPRVFEKKNGAVTYGEYEPAGFVFKTLKVNW